MSAVLMAVAIVKDGDKILLRKMDPAKSPYKELWALFGGRIEDNGAIIVNSLNKELVERWNFTVSIAEKLWWDEETKVDNDGVEKLFIYLDAICTIESGVPKPINENELLEWVAMSELKNYDINPPTRILLERLSYLD